MDLSSIVIVGGGAGGLELACKLGRKLGPDRDAKLVFACNGPECWKSFKASQAAIKAGYRKVHWFRGGFPEWRSSGMKFDAASAQ